MAKNWAISIGINKYEFLQPLNYAKRDAQLMQEFLSKEAGFEKVFFFSDDSPDIGSKSTRPYRANLLRVLRFEKPIMGNGDNFWFFFSGHGMRHEGRDYLMPSDGDPGDIENTAIPISYVTERLRRCGADNVVLILDACRNQGTRSGEGIGNQTADIARQTGVISIFSCSPNEYSLEIEELQQGAFTYALLEGLGVQGQCATVEKLNHYLMQRVPEINRQHGKKYPQTPYTIAEPVTKLHLVLIPKYVTLTDIATLKNDAYQAEVEKNFALAEQLWIRLIAAAYGQDIEAIKALQRIGSLSVNKSGDQLLDGHNTKGSKPANINSKLEALLQLSTILTIPAIVLVLQLVIQFVNFLNRKPIAVTSPEASIVQENKGSGLEQSSLSQNSPTVKKSPLPNTNSQWQAVNQKNLKIGTYRAEGSMNNNSVLRIASRGDRFCVEIVDGPAYPYAGAGEKTVSSISLLKESLYIDATGKQLKTAKREVISSNGSTDYFSFGEDERDWQWVSIEMGGSSKLRECLEENRKYVHKECYWVDGLDLDGNTKNWTEQERKNELKSCKEKLL